MAHVNQADRAEVTPGDPSESSLPDLDVATLRKDFPLLGREVNGHPITYLDTAASAQRPVQVLDAMRTYDETTHANVHRGVYSIAEEATRRFEAARHNVGRFIGAPEPAREIVFTKNATEALNLVAHTWGRTHLHPGDVIVLTEMEHHANIVPWHMLAAERELVVRWIPIDDEGQLVLDQLDQLVDGAKLVGVTCMSNVLGTLNPIPHIAEVAHRAGAIVVADGAQSVPHLPTDVTSLGVDFIAFSAHKMLGPTGIGVLWGREELLNALPPFLGGGEMILDVRKDGFVPNDIPWRFEAGTPPITEAIGLDAAVDYLRAVGMEAVRAHEISLTRYAMDTLAERFGSDLRIFGPPEATARGGVVSFAFRDLHPHDISQILDQYGVCVRAGHHCAKPLMRRLGVNATARASFGLYNDESDVDTLSDALAEAGAFFG
jgi:cysteine desulfurase/selenocysteine lyase